MGDLYDILGLSPDAEPDDIKRAFRRIARECHPDVAGEDTAKAERFKSARSAYETLIDPALRRSYDRRSKPRGSFADAFARHVGTEPVRPRAAAPGMRSPRGGRGGSGNDVGLEDLVGAFGFGDAPRRRARHAEAAVEEPTPRPLAPAPAPGEAQLDVHVVEALLGARLVVETPRGPVRLAIPAGTSSGTLLRLRGKGPADADGAPSDLVVQVRIVVPPRLDAESRRLVEAFARRNPT